jgi:hypothetical protein
MGTAVALQHHAATDQCPWCGTTIARARFIEIQTRIAEQERKKLAQERSRMQEELSETLQKAEARIKQEADKKVAAKTAECEKATAKLKEQEARAVAVRKEAEKQTEIRVKAELETRMEALTNERDAAAAKVKQVDAAKQKELVQQRASLEKDRDAKLLKERVQHNREREQLLQKIDGLTRQVQRKTSDDLATERKSTCTTPCATPFLVMTSHASRRANPALTSAIRSSTRVRRAARSSSTQKIDRAGKTFA